VVGYVKTNVAADLHESPDVLVYRKPWDQGTDERIFSNFRKKAKYAEASFPVQDVAWNTIPELNIPLSLHMFRTPRPTLEDPPLTILVKETE